MTVDSLARNRLNLIKPIYETVCILYHSLFFGNIGSCPWCAIGPVPPSRIVARPLG